MAKKKQTCPYCDGKIVGQCKCRLGDTTCENGHRWHTCPTHKTLVEGDSDHEKWNECSCNRLILPGFWCRHTERHHIWEVFELAKDAPLDANKAATKPEGAQAIGHVIVLGDRTILGAPRNFPTKVDAIRYLKNPNDHERELTEYEAEIVIPEGVTKKVNFHYGSYDKAPSFPGDKDDPIDSLEYTGPVTQKDLNDYAWEIAEEYIQAEGWWEIEGEDD